MSALVKITFVLVFPACVPFYKHILFMLYAYVCVDGWVVLVNCSPKCFKRSQSSVYLEEEHLLPCYYSNGTEFL